MDAYAVIGNPVSHSLSPFIHQAFAKQTGQNLTYELIEAPLDGFKDCLSSFINKGGKGCNITLPFKEEALQVADQCAARAEIAGAVNTIKVQNNNQLLGDNTDGIGLIRDLKKNHHYEIKNKKILILGAGGAVKGILKPLLDEQPTLVVIANRSFDKAVNLVEKFHDYGNISPCHLFSIENMPYDLIINGTSLGHQGKLPALQNNLFGPNSWFYDLTYGKSAQLFREWALSQGAPKALDGIGMLVEQAAESFYLWRGVRPETKEIREKLSQGSI